MTFNPTQKQLFNKNLNALSNTPLKESLTLIQSSKFELVLGKDNLDINLKDISIDTNINTSDNIRINHNIAGHNLLYQNPVEELQTMLNLYNDKYLLYPVLYFYGFGNGILFKALLQNKNLQHIVVFEKDIEIIWVMFHLLDFSLELQHSRLMILEPDRLDIQDYGMLCSTRPFFQFSRIYFLELMSAYYERFQEDILALNQKLSQSFKNAILAQGNDPLDALQGIEQFVYNLPEMITHSTYKELLLKRKGASETAIIVSTGPSLTKQLPLLKEYASKATIFCADSSYPILAKWGIKPDYVLSLERIPLTSEFFNNDFKEFDRDIVFILKSYIHPNTLKYLKKNNRNFMIVSTYANFICSLKLHDFGYFNMGHSVANMNFLLAIHLGYKNIVFIGQDLAYSKDGISHTKDYSNLDKHEGHFQRDKGQFQCLAYGGEGKVESSETWTVFRRDLEEDIRNAKDYSITTYNCTEGGARIEGTIEKPFLWACENLLSEDLKKPFESLEPLSLNKQNELMLKAYYRVYQSIKHCKEFSENLTEEFNAIQGIYLSLNIKDENLNLAIEKIDEFKNKLENIKQMEDLLEILQPLLTQFELNLARIYVLNPKTKEDSFNKSVFWIKEHLEFMELVYGHIKAQEKALTQNILPLEEKLKERGLEKWIKLVKK